MSGSITTSLAQLAHIEKLIIHCNMLGKIKISSQSLKALFLVECDKLVEVKIDTPKLCLLSYCGHSKISLSLNASVYLSEASYQMVRPVDHWDVQKIELLSKLSNSKLLYLTGFYVAKVFLLSFICFSCFLSFHIFLLIFLIFEHSSL